MTSAAPLVGGLAVLAAIALASAQARERPMLLVNESASLPRGLYLRFAGRTPERGDIVAVAPPLAARAYLAGLSAPADARLLKRIAGLGGDRVCAAGRHIRLSSRSVSALARDRQGRALGRWSECRVLTSSEVFLLGDSPSSFDSRYFGPVDLMDLRGVYREAYTW